MGSNINKLVPDVLGCCANGHCKSINRYGAIKNLEINRHDIISSWLAAQAHCFASSIYICLLFPCGIQEGIAQPWKELPSFPPLSCACILYILMSKDGHNFTNSCVSGALDTGLCHGAWNTSSNAMQCMVREGGGGGQYKRNVHKPCLEI